jgi:hypothetical protein
MRRGFRWLGFALAGGLSAALALAIVACGNGANDVPDCVKLENARCERAQLCGLDLQSLLPSGTSPADYVQACEYFYADACLHGFATPIAITALDVKNCLHEIETGNCNAVLDPQTAQGCGWLVPPDAGVDSGTTTDAVVAVVDTGVVVVVDSTVPSDAGADGALQDCYDMCPSMCAVGDSPCLDSCYANCQGS